MAAISMVTVLHSNIQTRPSTHNLHPNPLPFSPLLWMVDLNSVPGPRCPLLSSSLWLLHGWAAGWKASSRALWGSLFSCLILSSSPRKSSTWGSAAVRTQRETSIRLSDAEVLSMDAATFASTVHTDVKTNLLNEGLSAVLRLFK